MRSPIVSAFLGRTPQTLNSSNNLANRYAAVGRDEEALSLDEKTFEQRRRVLGDIHADTLMSRSNMAVIEDAISELLLKPLGMDHSFFFATDVMTRRFVVGHTQGPDGAFTVARPWALPRSGAPAGGITANAADQVAWIRFHLGDGTAADGSRVLSQELLDLMKEPTAHMPGSAIGDHVGIGWLLHDVEPASGSWGTAARPSARSRPS